MRSLFLLGVYCSFFFFGLRAPHILVLGYVWVDIFTPQLISYGILTEVPVSMLLGVAIILSMARLPSSPDVKLRIVTILVGLLAIWMTASLSWAVLPEQAWIKWNWAFKSVAFSCLVPFFFRNRVQIESLIWIIVLSGMGHCIPFGAKILVSGGGYGRSLGLIQANTGYGESSMLAVFAVTLIPMCRYLQQHTVLFERNKLFKLVLFGFMAAAVLTALGTYARAGLISLGGFGITVFILSKRKWIIVILALVFTLGVGAFMGGAWTERMGTIADAGNESSAMTRVGVWMWTIDYVKQHPLGGSFDMYRINSIGVVMKDGTLLHDAGRAFHSIYFEMLGELGLPGLLIYLAIVAAVFLTLLRIRSSANTPEREWMRALADALIISGFAFLAGGAFIGVGFNSYFYYIGAAAAAMANILDRSIREEKICAGKVPIPTNSVETLETPVPRSGYPLNRRP